MSTPGIKWLAVGVKVAGIHSFHVPGAARE